jgi:hypothetical protein
LGGFDIYCRRGDDDMDLMSSALLLGSMYTVYEVVNRIDPASIITAKFRTYDEHCLTIGYMRKGGVFKVPVTCDFKRTPHLLISGLSLRLWKKYACTTCPF